MQCLVIGGSLPNLNEYTRANRTNKIAGAQMKKVAETKIRGFILHQMQGAEKVESCKIHFVWVEKDKRRDLDNIAFAKKFILDALVGANILKGDGWSCIKGFRDSFLVDKYRPRIEVYIDECVEEEQSAGGIR